MPDTPEIRWIGRDTETGQLHRRIEAVAEGQGGSVLIEGEPGIGKTTLLDLSAGNAVRHGCRVLRATALELGQSFPLRPLLGCLEHHGLGPEQASGGDTRTMVLMERLARLITGMTDDAPLVLLLDDLHWADDATLLLWQRLSRAAKRLPLLLVATSRRVPRRRELNQLRRGLLDQNTHVLGMSPMSPAEVAELTQSLLGAVPGPELRGRLTPAGGNPLYVREVLDALRRAGGILVAGGNAELSGDAVAASPRAPLQAVTDRLGFLSAPTLGALRSAALLGTEFSATEFAAVLGEAPRDLLAIVDEAVAAGVLADASDRIRFRHAVIRQALYAAIPAPRRGAAHWRAAQALAAGGGSMERVAEQALQATGVTSGWLVDWILSVAKSLALRAPEVAVELLQRAFDQVPADDSRHELLERHLDETAFLLRHPAERNGIVRRLLDGATDPERKAQLTASLAHGLFWEAKWEEVMSALDDTERLPPDSVSALCANRLRGLRAITLWSLGRPEEAAALAGQVVAEAERSGDSLAEAYGRHTTASVLMTQRLTDAALAENARALSAAARVRGQGANEAVDTLGTVLVYRAVMLGILDRPEEALGALEEARELTQTKGADRHLCWIGMSQAVLNYWSGRWDAALADLDAIADLPALEWLPVLRCGVGVLVHGHRDQGERAQADLAELRSRPDPEGLRRGHSTYRIMADALMAEREGRLREALAVLLPTLDPVYARQLDQRYQWLPDVVRLALAVGDPATARAAAAIAAAEADQEPNAGRTAAAGRCRGLIDQDPEPLIAAADYYTRVKRPLQAGQTLEDLAVVEASLGDLAKARGHLNQAVDRYGEIGAAWDIKRADARLRALGVRAGQRGARLRPRTGWEALTPTELKVARFVSAGRSNPEIAVELFLSPRTVQTHVSHILAKLGVRSRTEVAREAARHLSERR